MSRHRNVRNMDYNDEYDGYQDVYGHSLDDEYGVSPSESQYLYDRSKPSQLSHFVSNEEDIVEELEEPEQVEGNSVVNRLEGARRRLDSLSIESAVAKLGADQEIRLKSCLEYIRNVVGDSFSEIIIKAHIIQANYNAEAALDNVLSGAALDPAAVLPEDLWKKAKTDSEDVTVVQAKKKGPPTVNSKSTNVFKKPEPVVKVVPASKGAVTLGFNLSSIKERSSSPLNTLQVDSDSRNSSKCPSPAIGRSNKASKIKEFKPEVAIQAYEKERGGEKELLNLLVIGHVDAGKSTLMGHVLFQLGQVPKKSMHKFEQESKKIGKQSFMYAWVLDESGEERTRGITMDVGQNRFETEKKSIVLLDAPGHKDFIPNMITGASQADVAILVVDSTNGEFETGFDSGGQTREHAFLVRSLGVTQLIIAVNKLDNMNWAQERFDDIRTKLTMFLVKQAGFKESDLTYVPCSGLVGENLTKKSTEPRLTSWYNGCSLVDAIDNLRPPERPVGKPLRITVNDVFKGTGGLSVSGRVETGMVQAGDKIMIQPVGEIVNVKNITIDEGSGTVAFAGDPVLLSLQGYSDPNVVSIGCVLSDPQFPCKVGKTFQARIVTFDAMTVPLIKGFTGVMHIGTMSEQVTVKKLINQLNKGTGELIKNKPRCLPKNSNGVIELETLRPVCIEEFKDVKELGRFTLRKSGVTIAAGVISLII